MFSKGLVASDLVQPWDQCQWFSGNEVDLRWGAAAPPVTGLLINHGSWYHDMLNINPLSPHLRTGWKTLGVGSRRKLLTWRSALGAKVFRGSNPGLAMSNQNTTFICTSDHLGFCQSLPPTGYESMSPVLHENPTIQVGMDVLRPSLKTRLKLRLASEMFSLGWHYLRNWGPKPQISKRDKCGWDKTASYGRRFTAS